MFTDSYWPRVNGVSVSVESFASALIKTGHQVLIICPYYPESPTQTRVTNGAEVSAAQSCIPLSGVPESSIIRVPSLPVFISKEDRIPKSHKLFWVSKQIDKFMPDIIHIHSEFVTAEFGYYCARVHKIPAVYTYHTLWGDYMKNYIPWAPLFILKFILWLVESTSFRRPYRVIVPSEVILDYARKYKSKKPPYLLPTGIDDKVFYPRTEAENADFRKSMEDMYPALKQKKILLYAGRVGKEKNLELILKAAVKIVKEQDDVVFLIVGSGPDIYGFKEECETLNLMNYFVFTGYLERNLLASVYCISRIFIFPSTTETQGLVTIEAMLSGIPVVAVGERGTLMVMRGDNGGFMVSNDSDMFAHRILDLLRDDELYRKKAAEALLYGKNWSMDIMVKRLENIYTEVIADYKRERKQKKH
jgi:glycosyltransferase involved in cell wall biosynthesis